MKEEEQAAAEEISEEIWMEEEQEEAEEISEELSTEEEQAAAETGVVGKSKEAVAETGLVGKSKEVAEMGLEEKSKEVVQAGLEGETMEVGRRSSGQGASPKWLFFPGILILSCLETGSQLLSLSVSVSGNSMISVCIYLVASVARRKSRQTRSDLLRYLISDEHETKKRLTQMPNTGQHIQVASLNSSWFSPRILRLRKDTEPGILPDHLLPSLV